ncbi:hypothetical protein Lfu02_73570 [Longispora fulva]|uniref:Uncharacterized protein n=1 Tax=Longispora fulva TaxID=619741 RepID=A0A8J7G777_9ACTN|nr:hypothetical protein [Longispora fulva]MBG6134270.1 hypothetical protein [Longispora fulva]GIG62985.1 hypothetical protein Lfu02_73570 [Longispora fulva]
MSKIAKIATVAALAVPILIGAAGTANASTPSGCSSVTQIGGTSYLTVGGETMASVKQYKGCGKNYAYLYVWAGYRSHHSSWDACASIVTDGGHTIQDVNCGGPNPVEVWSFGASTLSQCTQALGWNGSGGDFGSPVAGDVTVTTDVRC